MTRDEELYAAGVDVPFGERAAFLDRACGDDGALRQRIEKLLAANDEADAFFDSPVARCRPVIREEGPGDRIGRYKLLQQIGAGGCGVVYMAEQEEPVRRRVALKVIKLGMDTKAVIARFEAERQALALMDHPNIARVLDAGATENGIIRAGDLIQRDGADGVQANALNQESDGSWVSIERGTRRTAT